VFNFRSILVSRSSYGRFLAVDSSVP